jgi:hypothetical protein
MRIRFPRLLGTIMKTDRLHLAFALITVAVITVMSCACHSSHEEKRTLFIHGAVHVYPNEVPPAVYPGPDFIEVLGPKDQVKVRQVVYKNGYMAVNVRLKDGREGWVFSGESIELK